MAAETFVSESQQHPVLTLASRLNEQVKEWDSTLLEEPHQRIADGEAELTACRASLATLRDDLDDKRKRLVLDGLDAKALTATRKKLTDLELQIGDWEVGLLEARRAVAKSPGAGAVQVVQGLRRTATVIRDIRGALLSAVEGDRLPSSAQGRQLHAEVASAANKLDEVESAVKEVSGSVPTDIGETLKQLRRVLGLIRGEIPQSSRIAA